MKELPMAITHTQYQTHIWSFDKEINQKNNVTLII